MKLFERTGGYWLFYVSAAYLAVGMFSIYKEVVTVWLGPLYIFFLSMPFWFPPLGRAINLDVTWDKDMLNWFGKKGTEQPSNVVQFPASNLPEPKSTPAMPEVTPPKEEPPKVFYRLGLTDNNRVSFEMHYAEITMNKAGCQQMIDQLKFFQSQLQDEGDEGPSDDPDGGLPLPEEAQPKEKRTA